MSFLYAACISQKTTAEEINSDGVISRNVWKDFKINEMKFQLAVEIYLSNSICLLGFCFHVVLKHELYGRDWTEVSGTDTLDVKF